MTKWSLILMVSTLAAGAAPVTFESASRQTALLELYTSEGCSSCPPAERWLSGLKGDPGLWRDFVPVAFHVDYWNSPRWRDRFSSGEYSERQQDYARDWSADEVYTPEFVVNGKEWRNWFGFRTAPGTSMTVAGTLRVSSSDGTHWTADFHPTATGPANYEVTAALLANDLASNVTGGENEGRRLEHDFVALSLITRSLRVQTNGYQGKFIIDADPQGVTGRLALAVWVTRSGELEPLQATGGWLPEKSALSVKPTTK